jgi:hypothetical protein
MSGYVSTWDEWVRREQEVRARFPDCTGMAGCPAADHPVDCVQRRRDWKRRFRSDLLAALDPEGDS